ncbi:hypothetical protein NEOKW01_1527 [Nematocida sp. AWRm80]|nr:hypothetical protein NEOKW01_1527 [Nematocida sp. AWRm80]
MQKGPEGTQMDGKEPIGLYSERTKECMNTSFSSLLENTQRPDNTALDKEHSLNILGGSTHNISGILKSISKKESEDTSKDPVVKYISEVFSEVCAKIDKIHSLIERQNNLDTMMIEGALEDNREETKEETGWIRKLKEIIYGKEVEETMANLSNLSMQERIQPETELAHLSAEVPELRQKVQEMRLKQIEQEQETRRAIGECNFLRQRIEHYKTILAERENDLERDRMRLKQKKKELSDLKTQLSQDSTSEKALKQVAATIISQLERILSLISPGTKPLSQTLLLEGNTTQVSNVLLDIEAYIREEILKQRYTTEKRVKDLEDQNKVLQEKLSHREKEYLGRLTERETALDEKDILINKQRLMIKVLQSKLASSHLQDPPGKRLQNTIPPGTPSKQPSNASHAHKLFPGHQIASENTNRSQNIKHSQPSPIITELEERIESLKKKSQGIDQTHPHFKRYLDDIEDCKRRLTDFLRVQ